MRRGGQAIGLFVITFLLETLGFFNARKAQTKPPKDDAAAVERWNAEGKPGCGGLMPAGNSPNLLWNKARGE
jgi:hypothetical protein